jgi:hypothetical protein
MKSISAGLFFLSTQLALHLDTALTHPIVKTIQANPEDTLPASMSRDYSVMKRKDFDKDGLWQKRGNHQTLEVHKASTSSSSKEIKSTLEQASDEAAKIQIKNQGISRTKYHAKAIGIEAKNAGKAFWHGPIRGVAEMPASSLLGAGKHIITGCRYAGSCKMDKATDHFMYAPAKVIMGAAITPAYAILGGGYHAAYPIVKAGGHVLGMIKNGVHDGYKLMRNK